MSADAPHVVMLVDNPIVGDSRVQKEAIAMAQLGWRVTLVGRRLRKNDPKRAIFGGVEARMAFVESTVGGNRNLERATLLRAPLAYRAPRIANARTARAQTAVDAAYFDIVTAKAAGRDRGLHRLVTRSRMARAMAGQKVVARRAEATSRLRKRRQRASGLPDRIATRWWLLAGGSRAWERLDPGIWDWERAYGPVVDRLAPDLIHANDHRMLHVAARAKARAAAQGRAVKVVWDAHEFLEGLETSAAPESWLPAQVRLEKSFAPYADAVVTVSDVLAGMLQEEHGLAERPAVVANAPLMEGTREPEQSLRDAIGLADDVPLLVYSGGVSRERSVDTVVRALPELPGIHFVMVVNLPLRPIVEELLELAASLGVGDRVHTAPYVPVEQIVPYLSGADAGVHTLLPGPNNEIALATKYYEYAQSRLPIVVSDVKVMAETTRRVGCGEVFRPGDPADLARAARTLFADLPRYRAAFDDEELMRSWTWEAQARNLDAVYRRVLGRTS